MKRAILLTLVLAISISLASDSFALYSKTVPNVAETSFSAKIFDVSQTPAYSVADTQNLENNPSWMFMAFNSDTAYTYNTNISITLNTAVSGLRVSVFTDADLTNALAYTDFTDTSQTASMVISRQFLKGVSSPISMTLQYTYNYSPLSSKNKPSGLGSVLQATVTVGGTPRTDADIIADIMNNPFCSMYIFPGNNSKSGANSYLGKPTTIPASAYGIGSTGTINIKVSFVNGQYKLLTEYISPTSVIQTQMLSSYIPPTALVLSFEDFNIDSTITINKLTWNGVPVISSPIIGDGTKQLLIRNPTASTDSNFDVSFEFSLNDNFPNKYHYIFSSYFGYE